MSGLARHRFRFARPIIGVMIASGVMALDQATKTMVVANAATLDSGVRIFEGFNLVFHQNTGLAFGLFNKIPWWSLSLMAVVICACLGVLMFRTKCVAETFAYGAIIGGALGNVIDRAHNGAVTDFLDFYVGSLHWPTFNLADTFIVVGVGVLLVLPFAEPRAQGLTK